MGVNSSAVLVAYQDDGDGRVAAKLLLEPDGRGHPGESAAEDDNPPWRARLLGRPRGLRAEGPVDQCAQQFREQAEQAAVEAPPHERGELRAHRPGAQGRRAPAQGRNRDAAHQHPERYRQRAGRRGPLDGGGPFAPQPGDEGRPNQRAKQDVCVRRGARLDQGKAGRGAGGRANQDASDKRRAIHARIGRATGLARTSPWMGGRQGRAGPPS